MFLTSPAGRKEGSFPPPLFAPCRGPTPSSSITTVTVVVPASESLRDHRMGHATAELYPAKISKGQRLMSGFRLLNRFLHDFAGAPPV
jgi:hypothetical protein